MINSMTGFGRCEIGNEDYKITVEMKAVNHRYLDINIKMPKKLNLFESAIRGVLKQYIQRGKIDIFITYEDFTEHQMTLHYNQELAAEYVSYIRKMSQQFGLEEGLHGAGLSRYPEVLTMEETSLDEQKLWEPLHQTLANAIHQFNEARHKEGEVLKQDLLAKLGVMDTYVTSIEQRMPQILKEYRAKLTAKVQELMTDTQWMEEGRLAAEVILFADKICNDEETVRLKSHIAATRETLNKGGSIGRKLDFIAQEMNREANTILSKANDLTVSDIGINLKTDIEKVREQIQNIE